MKISKNQFIKITIGLIFLLSMIFANFYAVREMGRSGMEVYFYDKLLVAYNIGGENGMLEELREIPLDDKFPRELVLLKDFENKLKNLSDPKKFLIEKVARSKEKVTRLRDSRSIAIILIVIIFIWRLLANIPRLAGHKKQN